MRSSGTFGQELSAFLAETGITVSEIAASTLMLDVEIYELLHGRKQPSPGDLKRLFEFRGLRTALGWRGRLFSAYLNETYPPSWLEAVGVAEKWRPAPVNEKLP